MLTGKETILDGFARTNRAHNSKTRKFLHFLKKFSNKIDDWCDEHPVNMLIALVLVAILFYGALLLWFTV